MSLPYNGKIIPIAKTLRKNPTTEENHLWYDFLAKYPIRFQRQKTIGNFVVDFYCHQSQLIIEIDGAEHFTDKGKHHDKLRTKELEKYDLKVMRFSNYQIETNFDEVCKTIDAVVQERVNKRGK